MIERMMLLPGFPGGRIPRTKTALPIRPISEINSLWVWPDARKRTAKARKTSNAPAQRMHYLFEL